MFPVGFSISPYSTVLWWLSDNHIINLARNISASKIEALYVITYEAYHIVAQVTYTKQNNFFQLNI